MTLEVNIKNSSDGTVARVSGSERLLVQSEEHNLPYEISRRYGRTFQVFGTANLASGTVTVASIRNDDPVRRLVFSNLFVNVIGATGGTALPNTSNYFQVGFGLTVSSGGTTKTPVNTNAGSGVGAITTFTNANPTMTGTLSSIARFYPRVDGDRERLPTPDGIILGLNDTFTVQFVGNQTSGIAYVGMQFMKIGEDD